MKNQYKLSCNSRVFETACIQETRSETHRKGGSCVEIVNSRFRDGLVLGPALLLMSWKKVGAAS